MQCPKCKNSIPDDVLRCPHCHLKVRIVCPRCKTVSLMGKKFCADCGFKFFVNCPNCLTMNLSTSTKCRKCGSLLSPKKEKSSDKDFQKADFLIKKNLVVETTDISQVGAEKEFVREEPVTENTKQPQLQEDYYNAVESNETPEIAVFTEIEIPEESQPAFVENKVENETENKGDNKIENEGEKKSVNEVDAQDVSQNTDDIEHAVSETQEDAKPKQEVTDDGFIISSDDIEMSDEQIKSLITKVDEIDKHRARKAEAENLVRQKFDKQDEAESEQEETIPPEYVQLNQQDAQTTIIDAILNPLKRIISLNGKEGYGKSLILKYVRENLRKENYIWAIGECNALTQVTPFGYIQDVLLNLFNLSNFSVNFETFVNNNTKALEAQFFNLNPKEINDLFNFLYPVKTSDFNGILKRKEYTIDILKKVFENFTLKSPVIFVVDDFENIDGASFDFLKNIISDKKFDEKIKILLTNKYNKIAQGYFYNKELKHNNYSNIFLSGLNDEQCINLVYTLFGTTIDMPETINKQIIENAKGTSSYVEQACLLLNDIGAIKRADSGEITFNPDFEDYILPYNTHRIIEERLKLIEKEHPIVVKVLYVASILGNKFSIHQFENVLQFLQIPKEDLQLICNYLVEANYLTYMSENYFTFNNTLIWHYVYERAKTDDSFEEFNKNIFNSVVNLQLSNNSLIPLLLQSCGKKKEAYGYWHKNSELASYLGDTNLYVISLKQQLKISNDIADIISAQERIYIFEKMGKILYNLSPKEAINYLSASIAFYKDEVNYSPARIIELSAFLVQACNKTGDYLGVIEACDVALEALPDGEYLVEKSLINSKKLSALLRLGNCEEIINISNTELLDTMESALAKANTSSIVPDSKIFEIWVETSLNLAEAYALKGDKRVFETLSKIDDAIMSNKISDEDVYLRKILITKALAHSMRGETKLSAEILTSITAKYSTEFMEEEYILKWNFINIINKIVSCDYENLVDEMFQITTFADNIDDIFTKNILKLLLGYIIQTKSKNLSKAVEIYDEEIVFFSKEKIATGALLCWLLIANASLVTKGVDFALDIALKALDVAKGPKVNNNLFIIALKRLIADIYMIKHDYEAAKMYLEKAMAIAKNNDLRFMQMLLLNSFGKYNEEMVAQYPDEAQLYAQSAIGMYSSSLKLAQNLALKHYETNVKKDLTSFRVACQLKNITVIVEED